MQVFIDQFLCKLAPSLVASLTHCPQAVGFEAHSGPRICNYFSISGARVLSCCRRVRLSVTPWTVARQAPLSMGFPRQEDWSGLPFPPPGHLPDPGIEPACLMSPVLAGGFFTTGATFIGAETAWCWPWERPPGAAMVEASLLSGTAVGSGPVLCLLSQSWGHRLLLESWPLRQTSAAPWPPPRIASSGLRWGTGLQAGCRVQQAPRGPASFPGAWGPRRDSPRRDIQQPRGAAASSRASLAP